MVFRRDQSEETALVDALDLRRHAGDQPHPVGGVAQRSSHTGSLGFETDVSHPALRELAQGWPCQRTVATAPHSP